MANFYRGDIIRDYFTVLDSNNVPVPGATISVDLTQDPQNASFSLAVNEVGGGVYMVEFTAALAGTYFYRVRANTDPVQYFENDFDIDQMSQPNIITGVSSASGVGVTLYDLIRMIATSLGDFIEVVATIDGSATGTSFTDEIRLSAIPSQSLKGGNFFIAAPLTGNNFWRESRVTDSSELGQTLSLQPALPHQVLKGDVGWIVNLKSSGHWRQQYIDAINTVIRSSFPFHLVPVSYVMSNPFYAQVPRIAIPPQMTHLAWIEQTNDAAPNTVATMSYQNTPYMPGYHVDVSTGEIIFNGISGDLANGQSLRLVGFGEASILIEPTDTTTLPVRWLIDEAAALLRGSRGDQRLIADVARRQNRADENLIMAVTPMPPNVIRIR